jgi:hypothetical protein
MNALLWLAIIGARVAPSTGKARGATPSKKGRGADLRFIFASRLFMRLLTIPYRYISGIGLPGLSYQRRLDDVQHNLRGPCRKEKGAIREAEHKVEYFPVKPDPVLRENHSMVIIVKP